MNVHIDKNSTLGRFTAAGVSVQGWCKTRGFGRTHFYAVLNGTTMKRRDCVKALKIVDSLKKEGLLVLIDKPEDELSHTQAA